LTTLTTRQIRAVTLRASGEALKVVASELGVSLSTAARDLERALDLLGLATEADLAAVLGAAVGRGTPAGTVAHG
jgi:DNA-binding NarL/FixJ family response regulator